ncbi:hypothetical protein TNCV_2949931 [Trichonephila clavipes]|nr:hypothetical protein TNCV_2949931 [Trichonephila clavipes]
MEKANIKKEDGKRGNVPPSSRTQVSYGDDLRHRVVIATCDDFSTSVLQDFVSNTGVFRERVVMPHSGAYRLRLPTFSSAIE